MIKKLKLLFLPMLAFSLTGCGAEVVETGEVGIEVRFGEVTKEPLKEGLYFYNPFTTKIVTLTYRTQVMPGETEVYTKDIQQAKVQYVINYSLDATKAVEMYQQVGYNWEQNIIPQIVLSSIKDTTGKWNAVDVISNRQKVAELMTQDIASSLAKRDVHLVKFELTDVSFTDAFEQAVEAKVVATQEAEKAKNVTVTVEEQAKQKIIAAQAEAESMKIRTQALSQNQSLIMYEAVQKWNGVLPTMVTGDAMTMFNIPKP